VHFILVGEDTGQKTQVKFSPSLSSEVGFLFSQEISKNED